MTEPQVIPIELPSCRMVEAVLAIPGPLAGQFGHFREYSAADGGYTYLEATYRGTDATTTGTGIAEVITAPGTPSRALLGESLTIPVLYADQIAFADASLGFVPWPPA